MHIGLYKRKDKGRQEVLLSYHSVKGSDIENVLCMLPGLISSLVYVCIGVTQMSFIDQKRQEIWKMTKITDKRRKKKEKTHHQHPMFLLVESCHFCVFAFLYYIYPQCMYKYDLYIYNIYLHGNSLLNPQIPPPFLNLFYRLSL